MKICAIAAMDEDRVIGFEGKLPWHLPGDMKRFKTLTSGCPVLMGRKTFDSLPEKSRPLPNRKNLVLTRSPNEELRQLDSVEVWTSLEDCISEYKSGVRALSSDRLWVLGGSEIYWATLPYWDEVYLTKVNGKHKGDAFMPPFEDRFQLLEEEEYADYSFLRYVAT